MTTAKIKEPVKLRRKLLKNGNISLYLDIYQSGHRVYDFLHLYLIPEHSNADRIKNKETLSLANAIKSVCSEHQEFNKSSGGILWEQNYIQTG